MRVWIYTDPENNVWQASGHEFEQMPSVGEIIAFDPTNSWYEVVLVIHHGPKKFNEEYDAEIYAKSVNRLKVIEKISEKQTSPSNRIEFWT